MPGNNTKNTKWIPRELETFDIEGIPPSSFRPFVRTVRLTKHTDLATELRMVQQSIRAASKRLGRGRAQRRDFDEMARRAHQDLLAHTRSEDLERHCHEHDEQEQQQ